MKKVNVVIKFEEEKLLATKEYAKKKESNVEEELEEALQKIYEKYVPNQVREYIELMDKVGNKNTKKDKAKAEKVKEQNNAV